MKYILNSFLLQHNYHSSLVLFHHLDEFIIILKGGKISECPKTYLITKCIYDNTFYVFTDVYSYDEDDMVLDSKLPEHLSHFGIDMMTMEKVQLLKKMC